LDAKGICVHPKTFIQNLGFKINRFQYEYKSDSIYMEISGGDKIMLPYYVQELEDYKFDDSFLSPTFLVPNKILLNEQIIASYFEKCDNGFLIFEDRNKNYYHFDDVFDFFIKIDDGKFIIIHRYLNDSDYEEKVLFKIRYLNELQSAYMLFTGKLLK